VADGLDDDDRRKPLPMWVMYDRPRDQPNRVIVRKWLVLAPPESGAVPTREGFWTDTVDEARRHLDATGLTMLPPSPGDDRSIVGVWL
jgi:hypothetical protein